MTDTIHPTFAELARVFARIGCLSFGGPAGQIALMHRELVDEREVQAALAAFSPVWDTLSPREQARIIRLLVERVDYDGKRGTVSVTFRPTGIKSLAQQYEEIAA